MGFRCKISSCSIEFKLSSSLKRHLRKVHDTEPDPKPGKYTCDVCCKKFSSHFNLKRHKKLKHNIVPDTKPEGKYKTICPSCKLSLRSYKELLSHCHSQHNLKEDKEECEFASMKEFIEWKNKMEKDTYSMYKKQTSAKHLKQSIVTYYRCHRSGFFKSRSLNKRSMKSQGSCKINSTCPSFLKTITSASNLCVKVILWKTHLGHSQDLTHLVINSEERAKIAGKIAEGVTFDRIIGDARNQIYSHNCFLPEHLITRHDLRNFKRDYNSHFDREHAKSKGVTMEMIEEKSSSEDIGVNFSRSWRVQSASSPQDWYTVVALSNPICSNLCQLRCQECRVCLHMYTCSCLDNLMKHKMCKHIHACATLKSKQDDQRRNNSELDNFFNSFGNNSNVGNLNGGVCKKAEYLIGLVSNLTYDQQLLNKITKGLDSLIEIALHGSREESRNNVVVAPQQYNKDVSIKKFDLNIFNSNDHQQPLQPIQPLQPLQQHLQPQQHIFMPHQHLQQSIHPQQLILQQQHSIQHHNNLQIQQLPMPQQQILQHQLSQQHSMQHQNVNIPTTRPFQRTCKMKVKKTASSAGCKASRKSASFERLTIIENLKNNNCTSDGANVQQLTSFEHPGAYLYNNL